MEGADVPAAAAGEDQGEESKRAGYEKASALACQSDQTRDDAPYIPSRGDASFAPKRRARRAEGPKVEQKLEVRKSATLMSEVDNLDVRSRQP